MVVACTRSPREDGAPAMTTPAARRDGNGNGKITRQAVLAAALTPPGQAPPARGENAAPG